MVLEHFWVESGWSHTFCSYRQTQFSYPYPTGLPPLSPPSLPLPPLSPPPSPFLPSLPPPSFFLPPGWESFQRAAVQVYDSIPSANSGILPRPALRLQQEPSLHGEQLMHTLQEKQVSNLSYQSMNQSSSTESHDKGQFSSHKVL